MSTTAPMYAARRHTRTTALVGPVVVVGIVIAYVSFWMIARPAGQPTGRYIGEMAGMLALLLLSLALVTSSGLMRVLEPAFGGFDRVMVWHRGLAIGGVLMIIPHRILIYGPPNPYQSDLGDALGAVAAIGLVLLVLWALAPRLRRLQRLHLIARMAGSTYEKWRIGHRFAGLFVALATIHAAVVDPALHASSPLRTSVLVAGGLGVAAYLYRELLAQRLTPVYHYIVQEATRLNENTLEVGLAPIGGQRIRFVAGQFIYLALGAPEQFDFHPFTVASAPGDEELRLSVKASGDYTRDLYSDVRPGIEARVVGPFGTFDYRLGNVQQIWIAAGIGITPFISWIRNLDRTFEYNVDLYYSVASESAALFVDEIRVATAKYPSLELHLINTDHDSALTPQQMTDHPLAQVSIYMCGPPEMMRTFAGELRKHGAARDRIRWEEFGLR